MDDHLDLFLIDAVRAADSLAQAAGRGPDVSVQAAERAAELARLLRAMGLGMYANTAERLSNGLRHEPGLLPIALNFAGVVASMSRSNEPGEHFVPQRDELEQIDEALDQIGPGSAPGSLPSSPPGKLASMERAISALEALIPTLGTEGGLGFGTSGELTELDLELELESEFPAHASAAQPALHAASQRFGAGAMATLIPSLAKASKSAAEQVAAVPVVRSRQLVPDAERAQTLRWIQTARVLVHGLNPPASALREIDASLNALQDWVVPLAQIPLSAVLPGFDSSLDYVYVDADMATEIVALVDMLQDVQSVRGSVVSHTVFLDVGCQNRPVRRLLSQLGKRIAGLGGRVEPQERQLRLIVPATLTRLRAVPFERDGEHFAVSWAQFVDASPLPDDEEAQFDLVGRIDVPRVRIVLHVGHAERVILASSLGLVSECAAWPKPARVDGPLWLHGALVSGSGQAYPWILP